MKKTFFILTVALMLATACDIPKTEYSDVMTEKGTVFDTTYIPKGHGKDTAIGFSHSANGGNGGITITPVDIKIPERFAVVFKCQHGKFVIDGKKAKDLYSRLDPGDEVVIKYREVYKVTSNGKSLVDLDFIDATKTEK